jgi:hypothetical protein
MDEGGIWTLPGDVRTPPIGLAGALYSAPRLLFLDEPNSNLDEQGERACPGDQPDCRPSAHGYRHDVPSAPVA